MATCDISTLLTSACASGFKCLSEDQYRSILLQLLCDIQAGGGGGALTPYTKTNLVAPITLPYSFTATTRTHIDVNIFLAGSGGGTLAQMVFNRTGFSAHLETLLDDTASDIETKNCVHFDLSPGDTLLIQDASIAATATILAIAILEE